MPINSPDVFNPVGDATITGGGGGGDISIKEEGVELTSAVTSIDFTGKGSTASNSGTEVTVNSPARVVMTNFSFFDGTARNVYIPVVGETEVTTIQRYTKFIMPFSGTVKSIQLNSAVTQVNGTGNIKFTVFKVTSGTSSTTSSLEVVTVAGVVPFTTMTFNFTSNSFNKGDTLAFYLEGNGTDTMNGAFGTLYFEVNS